MQVHFHFKFQPLITKFGNHAIYCNYFDKYYKYILHLCCKLLNQVYWFPIAI